MKKPTVHSQKCLIYVFILGGFDFLATGSEGVDIGSIFGTLPGTDILSCSPVGRESEPSEFLLVPIREPDSDLCLEWESTVETELSL